MANRGYMRGALPQTQQFYAEISSQFVPASSSGGIVPTVRINITSASAIKAAAIIDAHVSQAVNGISTGALGSMVEGEQPVVVVTTNIRAKMESQILTNQTMAPLTPPQSAEEAQYGATQPIIQVVGSNLLKCNFGGGYSQTSTVQFGSNPHQGSASITSPLLQFGSRSTTKIPKSVHIAASVSASFAADIHSIDKASERQRPETKRRKARELISGTVSPSHCPTTAPSSAPTRIPTSPSRPPTIAPTVRPSLSHTPSLRPSPKPSRIPTASPTNVVPIPEYYVTLPLTGNKHYNLTQFRLSKGSKSLTNYSIPACSLYVGGKYVPCGACNITSFTMVNVTYGCYDITLLCPAATPSVTVRRLEMYDEPDDYHRNGGGTLDVGGPRDEDEMDISIEGLGWNSHSYIPPDNMLEYIQHPSNASAETSDVFVSGQSSGQIQGLHDNNTLLRLFEPSSETYQQLIGDEGNRQLRGGGVGGGKFGTQKNAGNHDDLVSNTFNTSATDDHSDDAPKEDDTFALKSDTRQNEFGALAEAVVAELQTVLSLNFNQIDLAKAAPVLAFVVSLTAVWLLGSLFFLRWDKSDRHRLVYLREYEVKASYKLIKEDIHKGGSGVIESGDAKNIVTGDAMTLHEQINRTLDSLKMSLSPKEFFNSSKRNSVYAGANTIPSLPIRCSNTL